MAVATKSAAARLAVFLPAVSEVVVKITVQPSVKLSSKLRKRELQKDEKMRDNCSKYFQPRKYSRQFWQPKFLIEIWFFLKAELEQEFDSFNLG